VSILYKIGIRALPCCNLQHVFVLL